MTVESYTPEEKANNELDMTISLEAATKLSELFADEDDENLSLRVFVTGGGCSGFQYGFSFEDEIGESDCVLDMHGIKVVVDMMSYQYLIGAKIDLKQELMSSQFTITNPNAKTTCGCGSSFSV